MAYMLTGCVAVIATVAQSILSKNRDTGVVTCLSLEKLRQAMLLATKLLEDELENQNFLARR